MVDEIARSIVDYLAIHAEESREKTAVICGDRELTYAALQNLSERCRWVFKNLNLERGDRVALMMCDCPEWIVTFLGVIGLGAIAVPCSTMLGAADIRSILNDCGARMAVITSDQCELLQAVLAEQSLPELEVVLVAGGGILQREGVKTLNFETALAGRFCASAGEALPARIFQEWRNETGLEILDALGSTELLHVFIANQHDRILPGSSGMPVIGYEVQLLDEAGKPITGAGRGELQVRGASAFSRYWNRPEKTAETINQGWVKTGDIYRRDEAGFYWYEGRCDDMFKSKGMWISPAEIEEVLCENDAVLEAAVVPEPDADGANVVAVYVVLRPGVAVDQEMIDRLKAEAGAKLPRYKRPEQIYFLGELPRTATGKVQRFKLRDQRSS